MVYLWSFFAFSTTLFGSGILLANRDWSKLNIWRILAFGSGILLSVSFIHVVPEAFQLSPNFACLGILAALLMLFSIEGFTMMHSCAEFAEDCPVHIVGWSAFGALSLHGLLDGAAISVAFQESGGLGRIVAAAILVHKFTDGLTLTGLLLSADYSRQKCLKIVTILALTTPLGVLIFAPIADHFPASMMGALLGFVAGGFFYVGASDILPRLHKVRDAYCWVTFAFGLILGGIKW